MKIFNILWILENKLVHLLGSSLWLNYGWGLVYNINFCFTLHCSSKKTSKPIKRDCDDTITILSLLKVPTLCPKHLSTFFFVLPLCYLCNHSVTNPLKGLKIQNQQLKQVIRTDIILDLCSFISASSFSPPFVWTLDLNVKPLGQLMVHTIYGFDVWYSMKLLLWCPLFPLGLLKKLWQKIEWEMNISPEFTQNEPKSSSPHLSFLSSLRPRHSHETAKQD